MPPALPCNFPRGDQVRGLSATYSCQTPYLQSSAVSDSEGKAAVTSGSLELGEHNPTINGCVRRLLSGPIHTQSVAHVNP